MSAGEVLSPLTQAIEDAIRDHHVLEVDYQDREGDALTLEVEPYGYRHNEAGHVVLWVFNEYNAKWEQLVVARIGAVRDTGRTFVPRADWGGR